MVSVEFTGEASMNEVCYIITGEKKLKSEIIRVKGNVADLQVFEMTAGIGVGETVEFTGELLSVQLGPGLLGQIYDGLQNPLPELAEQCGFFLDRGVYLSSLDEAKVWEFTPSVEVGAKVGAGEQIGFVKEGIFSHWIMVPFQMGGVLTVKRIVEAGSYTVNDTVAEVEDEKGDLHSLTMVFNWPVKRAVDCYAERLKPSETLITKLRIIDTFIPVAKGGTYCIPGPFGAGKTVLQQVTSRNAEVDVVIIAACGERAGEVVETIKEFPELIDPKTGRSLMERTVIICNTSSFR